MVGNTSDNHAFSERMSRRSGHKGLIFKPFRVGVMALFKAAQALVRLNKLVESTAQDELTRHKIEAPTLTVP